MNLPVTHEIKYENYIKRATKECFDSGKREVKLPFMVHYIWYYPCHLLTKSNGFYQPFLFESLRSNSLPVCRMDKRHDNDCDTTDETSHTSE